jgi:hypothetical protein
MASEFTAPYPSAAAVSPSDTLNFDGTTYSAAALQKPLACSRLYVGGAGVVAAVFENGAVVNITATAGLTLPLKLIRVNNTNTTATVMTVFYETP